MSVVTNHYTNPSGEKNDNRVTAAAAGQTTSRSNEASWRGDWSFKHVHSATGTPAYKRINHTNLPYLAGQTAYISIRFYIPPAYFSQWDGHATATLRDDNTSTTYFTVPSADVAISGPDELGWYTASIVHTVPETRALTRVYFNITGNWLNASVAYFDGWMATDEPDTPYFDGSTTDSAKYNYTWTGVPHESTSRRTLIEQEAPRAQVRVLSQPFRRRRGWRYFATRLNGDGTETLLHPDLPMEDVTVESVLSGHNALSGKFEPVFKTLLAPDGEPLFKEYSTAIYAENDGDIRGGGIMTDSAFDGPAWTVEATGFTGYAIDMPYVDGGYKGIKVDPIDVARDVIWGHIQSKPGGNLGLEFDQVDTKGKVSIGTELRQVEFDTQSGPVSFEAGPYKLNWYTNHDLAADFDALAAETPFDYSERHYWDGDAIRHHVDIGYPRLGRRRTDLRFVYGVNIFDAPSVARTGALYASGSMVLGAGEGAAMIMSLRERPKTPGGRLRRIAVVVDDTIKSKTAANKRADAENQWRARLDDVESVIVQNHSNAPLGAVGLGDEIRIEGKGDWVGIDMWVRVLGIAFQPANGNIAEYTIARTDKLIS